MSRTRKGKKAPGYEYWSKRPGSNKSGSGPGRIAKTRTHRLERLEGKKQIRKALDLKPKRK